MMSETVMNSAMQIILHAGDARVSCKQALDAIAAADFSTAEEKMKEAQDKITLAHKVQTDAIQEETRGEESEYSLLFAHAQDTLMTIYSEINIAKQLLKIFTVYDKRIAALEK
ncbi:PTS system cellobiose-specific IIA component [Breznakia sp. PF5-3]|uniref:PTS lactose/cellobiose transporter subunit IIA n=1 Tax=unclassified Breznakia TaxID=2623764 RepID=UPI002406B0A9|nr:MULTISPECIES: PTS lactose/cellobiose transporter subunit IIA [unclassified Breznakia]MDF9824284.1 PTS system cellobiose-specific IIA component [Breznakia sp. PM6-1]MDF9835508.1 PTS system cellobiose-specific IIA component [Breznakia sp. PF5-3]MDF9838018.1 PTS system cellobiose-specific IIA component [Breznakia sp. PFB2-8]MDF9859396.1 PTS system cellobiose-specific IIA component [Breznakia sp. PH5-24]